MAPLGATSRPPFAAQLRRWRLQRGLSQLDLSLESGVSTRHLSFLETGCARPSWRMVARLGGVLDLPLRQRNRMLVAARYAPLYGETDLEDPRLAQVRWGLEFLLRSHEPYPAFVLDRQWNIVMSNRPHRRLLAALLPGAAEIENALRLVFDPARLRPAIVNWPQVARTVLRRLERQLGVPEPDAELAALRDEVLAYPGVGDAVADGREAEEEIDILVPLELEYAGVRLSWFTILASFGTPLDVTLQEAVIESLLLADEATCNFAHCFAEG